MSFLRIKNLCLKFGDWTLDVSIELGAGRCLGIIGPSGAGKSTLLSLIAGFETPYSGDIFIDLTTRQLTALSGLGSLRDLDL